MCSVQADELKCRIPNDGLRKVLKLRFGDFYHINYSIIWLSHKYKQV